MIITFNGNEPQSKFYRIGVVANNNTDALTMRVAAQQGHIDLRQFRPWLKITNNDLSFIEKTDKVQITPIDDCLELFYTIPNTITLQGNVDVQLSFENTDGGLIWQSLIFNVQFDNTLAVDAEIEKQYPTVLQEFDVRITKLENTTAEVAQYPSRAYFPNIGKVNAVYIDIADNKAYRYDTDNNTYYVVGSDYEQIKIINCQGG